MKSGKVIFLPNPGVIRINEVTVGLSSIDVIAHLAATEMFRLVLINNTSY